MVETDQTRVISPPGSWLYSVRRDHPLRPAAGLQHTGWFPTGGGEADRCGFAPDDKHHENNGSPEGRGPSAQTPAGRGAGHVGADEEIRFAPSTLPSTGWLMEAPWPSCPLSSGLSGLFEDVNLCGLYSEDRLLLDEVRHRGFLALSEQGVEAAAVTSVAFSRTFNSFSALQPFVFLLWSEQANMPLFVGRVIEPWGKSGGLTDGGRRWRSWIKSACFNSTCTVDTIKTQFSIALRVLSCEHINNEWWLNPFKHPELTAEVYLWNHHRRPRK